MVKLRFGTKQKASLALGILILAVDVWMFHGKPWFLPIIAAALTVAWLPFWMDVLLENKKQKELEARFPDFVRNLTGAIKSGMPASQAVIHVADTDYGSLTPYIKKLANQIEWAIPFHKAFTNFGRDTNNTVIKRAIATVIQAEQAGGNIEDVLMSITDSLLQIKRIKEERKASIHSQVLQSYIIFFVFLGVMVVIQNLLIPYMSKLGPGTTPVITAKVSIDFSSATAFAETLSVWFVSMYGIFLMMSVIQGLFAGVVLGKLAEGDLTSGLKHSLILGTLAFIVITFSQSLA
jgi:flagellar protein FlaJ